MSKVERIWSGLRLAKTLVLCVGQVTCGPLGPGGIFGIFLIHSSTVWLLFCPIRMNIVFISLLIFLNGFSLRASDLLSFLYIQPSRRFEETIDS